MTSPAGSANKIKCFNVTPYAIVGTKGLRVLLWIRHICLANVTAHTSDEISCGEILSAAKSNILQLSTWINSLGT